VLRVSIGEHVFASVAAKGDAVFHVIPLHICEVPPQNGKIMVCRNEFVGEWWSDRKGTLKDKRSPFRSA
jgi:hypothetical protein